MQKVLFKPNNNITADLGIHYSSTSDIPRYDRLIRYNNQNDLYYSEWYYGPQEWLLINSQISIDTQNSKLFDRAKFTTAYQKFNESRNSRKTISIFNYPLHFVLTPKSSTFIFPFFRIIFLVILF